MRVQTGGDSLELPKAGGPELGYLYGNALTQNVYREALKAPLGWEARIARLDNPCTSPNGNGYPLWTIPVLTLIHNHPPVHSKS